MINNIKLLTNNFNFRNKKIKGFQKTILLYKMIYKVP